MSADLLPDSRPKEPKGRVFRAGVAWIPIACANCAAPGGYVPEEQTTYVSYFCRDCAVRFQEQTKAMLIPDEVHWQLAVNEQIEKYGRLLTPEELAEALLDGNNSLSKLARDR
jgi:hypothetical protein